MVKNQIIQMDESHLAEKSALNNFFTFARLKKSHL
jgi:hypothetical protein